MYIYHYSKERYPELLTRRAAGASVEEIKKAERDAIKFKEEGAYVDHISFFMDPLPSRTIANVFKDDHDVWYKGNVLYEYVVDVSQFANTLYRVVESKKKTAFMDAFIKEHNWVNDDPALLAKYLDEINKLQRNWGELGSNLAELKRQIALNRGNLEKDYLEAAQRSDFEDGKMRYASNVPHLMIYPRSGRVTYQGLNRVTIGSDVRIRIITPSPGSLKW